ncbi:major allergen Pru ar 1-like [Euphorbia lathyris]|uniref:major allergen Pru ar 1-like n=1 Tax=Euphorbia lathyris TaxID=212925 RepID=UPI0033133C16
MGIVTVEREVNFSIPKTTIFKVFAQDNHNIVPKATPHISCEVLPCTAKKATFGAAGGELKHVKTKDEVTDNDNFTHSYTIVEGEPWSDSLDKVLVTIKVESTPNGGSVLKSCSKYVPKPNCKLDEGRINAITESIMGLYKHVEAQLLANPTACN